MSSVWVALRMLDWSTFHRCDHPAQRWKGAILPCAECYEGYPRWKVAERLPLHVGYSATLPPDHAMFRYTEFKLSRYETKEGATGTLWEPEDT